MNQKPERIAILLLLILGCSYQLGIASNPKKLLLKRTVGDLRKNNPVQELQDHLGSNPYFPYKPIAGYVDIYDQGNSMFYWLSPARENPNTAPIIIWLEGGPGISSVGSLFYYLGPLEVIDYPKKNKKATIRKVSWNQRANIVFPDYPLGTGFSTNTASHVTLTGKEIQYQILKFYEGFLKKHPEFKRRPIYVAGRSYGGHGATYTAYALKYSGNQDIDVKGLFITSGLISGPIMYGSYPEFAYQNQKYTELSKEDYETASQGRDVCVHLMEQGPNNLYAYNGFFTCEIFLGELVENILKKKPYFDTHYMPGHFPYDYTYVNFLNSTGVKEYLQVKKNKNFIFSNNTIFETVGSRDIRIDVSPLIGRMLDDGVKTYVIDGEVDFICNYQQSQKSFTEMDWSGKQGWAKAVRKPCKYGLCKEYKNLRQIRVPGSGHGISLYRPKVGLELINEFMFGENN